MYFNWNSFAPDSWKKGTLKTLTQCAYKICSIRELLDTELKHLEKDFVEKNYYPKWIIRQVLTQVKLISDSNLSPSTIETIEVSANENETVTKKHMLLLPYQGGKGIGLTKSLKRNLENHYPNNIKTQVTFIGQKLSTQFNVKVGPTLNTNMTLLILVNVQNRILPMIILVNLLGESLSEL